MSKILLTLSLLVSVAFLIHAQAVENQPAASEQAQSAGAVKKVVICSGIESREPADDLSQVDASMSRVYCWTNIQLNATPALVKHVWYADGTHVGEVSLNIKGSPWRTWSSKNVWPGQWKVEVQSETGEVLASKEFQVSRSPAN